MLEQRVPDPQVDVVETALQNLELPSRSFKDRFDDAIALWRVRGMTKQYLSRLPVTVRQIQSQDRMELGTRMRPEDSYQEGFRHLIDKRTRTITNDKKKALYARWLWVESTKLLFHPIIDDDREKPKEFVEAVPYNTPRIQAMARRLSEIAIQYTHKYEEGYVDREGIQTMLTGIVESRPKDYAGRLNQFVRSFPKIKLQE